MTRIWYDYGLWRHSQVVRQRSAKPPPPVQIWVPPFPQNLAIRGVFVFLPISRALPDWGKAYFYSGT
jgi:hypothetical protein